MINVGVVGVGLMGRMHLKCYKELEDVQVVAVCDVDIARINGQTAVSGNLRGGDLPLDLSKIHLYHDYDEMLDHAGLDAISITVPTYMHRDYTLKALNKGVHVLCEKPMALDEISCADMIRASEKNRKILQIGHCLRFWPEYIKAGELVRSGTYGAVKVASFKRLSAYPKWSWGNWLMTEKYSGGAIVDLHIHDSDFIQYLFGMPKAVNTRGIRGAGGAFDHTFTDFIYDDNDRVVNAEVSWIMSSSFGFEMGFTIVFEEAVVIYSSRQSPTLQIFPQEGEPFSPSISEIGGHAGVVKHFIDAIHGRDIIDVNPPSQSLNSVRIVLAERESAKERKEVALL